MIPMSHMAFDDDEALTPMTAVMTPPLTPDSGGGNSARPDGIVETTVLVVDDSSTARLFVRRLVERLPGFRVVSACDGREALAVLGRESCAAVVTDLHMPGMDGLELVEAIADRFPLVPVILMTAQGSEDIAVKALQGGAASYVSKRALEQDLTDTLERVLHAAKVDRRKQGLLECVRDLDCTFVLENDAAMVPLLVTHLQEYMVRMKLCEPKGRLRLGIALEEAILNGIYHGNLELSSALRQDGTDAFQRLAEVRRRSAPYADRRLHVHVKLDAEAAVFVIRDEGPGFDVAALPDPTDPENMLKASGRGLLLIRTFMDEATHNTTGNEIRLVRRRP
jgi:CheY-like chemotaxis protein